MLIVVSLITIIYKINNVNSKYDALTNEVTGIILKINSDDKKIVYTVKAKENLIIYYYGNNIYNIGDKIKITGKLEPLNSNTIFNLFNYKKYMLSKNTYYSIKTDNIVLIKKNTNILYKIKSKVINGIVIIPHSEYLKTFILGDNSDINEIVLSSFRTNGISHLFSISGMHVTLLSTIILFILNKIKKSNINYFFVILFLLFYIFFTDFSPSILRATYLFILLTINKAFKLKLTTLKIIIIILCINLIINPYNIYNTGFIFSYTISIYLIIFNKMINRHKNYIIKILITSCISFLASIPILINNYFSINIMTILNNIIFVPLISIIVFPFSIIVLFIPKLSFIFNFIINILESLSLFISAFKIEIILSKMSFLILIVYYLIISYVLYKVYNKKYQYIVLIIILIFIHANINAIKKETYISFIDVGQGESILIHSNNKTILIDTGGLYNYNIYIDTISYLHSEGISKINYLILSHGDYDHIGEAINLINNFKVEKVIFNCGPYNDLEKELIKVLEKKNIPYYSCIKELNIDKNKLYFLQTKEYDNENDNSNVIYTELNGYKFMFMGDASITTEKEILDKYNLPNIDVLKVGHHGSKTSSSIEFINEINPKYSIISVGKNNRYGHPNKEVLNTLDKSKIYRTDQDGSVMFKIKNNKLKIETCSP